jgi:hypothetical protein
VRDCESDDERQRMGPLNEAQRGTTPTRSRCTCVALGNGRNGRVSCSPARSRAVGKGFCGAGQTAASTGFSAASRAPPGPHAAPGEGPGRPNPVHNFRSLQLLWSAPGVTRHVVGHVPLVRGALLFDGGQSARAQRQPMASVPALSHRFPLTGFDSKRNLVWDSIKPVSSSALKYLADP